MGRLIIDGGKVYEIDENCLKEKSSEQKNIRSAEEHSVTSKQKRDRQKRGRNPFTG